LTFFAIKIDFNRKANNDQSKSAVKFMKCNYRSIRTKKIQLTNQIKSLCFEQSKLETKYSQTCANDHLSTKTTLNPAQAILVLNLPLNNNHLSTTTSSHLNLVQKWKKTCLQRPLLSIMKTFIFEIRILKLKVMKFLNQNSL